MDVALADLLGMASAVVAAQQSGLLAGLAGAERRSAAAWAESLRTDARATGVVLDVLVAAGAAERTDLGYAGSTAFRGMFERVPGGPAMAMLLWAGVGEFLKSGKPLLDMDGNGETRASLYSGVVASLGGMFEQAAAQLAASLPDTSGEVLDVGCGSGVWGLALGQRYAGARITGLDWPEVLRAFDERARAMGLMDRVATLPGDMHALEIPRGRYDTVVIANVLRLEQPAEAEALVQRLAHALARGGLLVVVDALAHGSREKNLARSVYGLHLALRTRAGRVHPPEDVARWMACAGLVDVRAIDLGLWPGAVAAMTARRAGLA